jgi:uncharacterized protein YjeT (DUF2065 family)
MKTTFLGKSLPFGVWLLVCVLCGLMLGCTPKGAKEIIGKWQAKDGSSLTEFRSDGKVIMGEGSDKMTGNTNWSAVSG